KIEKMLPMGPVFHGAGLNCTVMSLDGHLHVGFIACKDLVSDPWPLAHAVEEALDEFLVAAQERESSGAPAAERKTAEEVGRRNKERKKAPAKKSAAKKAPAKKTAGTKTAATKAPAKKAPAKKTAAKKSSTTPAGSKPTGSKPTGSPPAARPGGAPATGDAGRGET